MKAKKKNGFFTFCCSLLPGAGEMYMGFMKMGLSLMVLFFLAIMVPVFLRVDELAIFAIVIWFYSFFLAHHLASLKDQDFDSVEDRYLYGMDMLGEGKGFFEKYRNIGAVLLILAGTMLLWNTVTDMAYDFVPHVVYEVMRQIGYFTPRVVVSVLIILAGGRMIGGKKKQLADPTQKEKEQEAPEGGED